MSKRIEKLVLNNFKGATCPITIEFDPNKPAVMVFGENGTGKSTVVDAIDFVCNNSFGSLEDRSTPHRNAHYVPSLGEQPNSVEVKLYFDGDEWVARIGRGNKPATSGPPELPNTRILRRSKILQVVNGQPKERFEALKSFIDVPNCEKSEQSLRDALKDTKKDYDDSSRDVGNAHEALQKLWELEGKPGEGYLSWAQSKTEASEENLKKEVTFLKSVLDKIPSCESSMELKNQSAGNVSSAQTKLDSAEEAFNAAQKEEAETTASLIKILEDTQTYLEEKPDINSCPVCEQSVFAKDLQERIQQRLAAMTKLRELKKAVDNARQELQQKKAILSSNTDSFTKKVRDLAITINKSDNTEIAALELEWDDFDHLLAEELQVSEESISEAERFLSNMKTFESDLTQVHDDKNKTLNQLTAIIGHLETIDEKTTQAENLEQITQKLDELLSAIETERKAYVEEMLANIGGMVEDLYTRVHPGEGIGGIRWYLKPNVIGSLEFEGEFQDQTVPPQAYFSESHLDTLGVCVFLALAKYYNDENTIIVLDDVITSVDQAHMDRFMQVLHDEAKHFNQLIFTTHYRAWRDRYRYGAGPAANIQLIELMPWSLSRGIRHTKTKLNAEELKEYLEYEPFDRQIVASKAGILLESLLDHIAMRYGCKLPRKPQPNYTLGDYLLGISARLKRALKIEKQDRSGAQHEIELKALLDSVGELMWIRDQVGCHFSIAGKDLSDSDVKTMAEKTLVLAKAMVCDECGQLALRDRSGSYWECHCGKNKMYPLQIPN